MIKKPRGTEDILPEECAIWRKIEQNARDICHKYGYKEIRTPVFEETALFSRGVGDTTDVVQKEMYTFEDKGGRSITLRPEGTASLARSYIENSLYAAPQPTKLYYLISCYRYEKPQSGRLREFHQFGIECYGAEDPAVDCEAIALALDFFNSIGITGLELSINSIGCEKCKPNYNKNLKEYFLKYEDKLCETCRDRLQNNPMRIFDCKSPICQKIAQEAPKILDYLCDDCKDHFEHFKEYLDVLGIKYKVDPNIVRGLDYYTRTVFEIISKDLGVQSALCGGGRYNGLIEELGGKPAPGIGFAIGIERLLMIVKKQGIKISEAEAPDIFVVTIGDNAQTETQKLVYKLRCLGIYAERDLCFRSVKAQMKYANKIGAKFCLVMGDDEINSGQGNVKNMKTGDTILTELNPYKIYDIIAHGEEEDGI